MFRLQQAMKAGDKDEILLFFEQYFTDEEEIENQKQMKGIEEEREQAMKLRGGNSAQTAYMKSKREELKLEDMLNFSSQREVIGIVISSWAWDINTFLSSQQLTKAKKYV